MTYWTRNPWSSWTLSSGSFSWSVPRSRAGQSRGGSAVFDRASLPPRLMLARPALRPVAYRCRRLRTEEASTPWAVWNASELSAPTRAYSTCSLSLRLVCSRRLYTYRCSRIGGLGFSSTFLDYAVGVMALLTRRGSRSTSSWRFSIAKTIQPFRYWECPKSP